MGEEVTLVSSAEETAKDVYRTLVAHGLERGPTACRRRSTGSVATGDPTPFGDLARRFLGPEVERRRARRRSCRVRLTVVGCSGSFPGPESPASCYLVEADDDGRPHLAGPARPRQRRAGPAAAPRRPRATSTRCCLATCTPTTSWTPAGSTSRGATTRTAPSAPRCRCTAPSGTATRLVAGVRRGRRRRHRRHASTFAEWTDGRPVTVGPLTVTPRPSTTRSRRTACGSSTGGRVLAYSGDTDACAGAGRAGQGARTCCSPRPRSWRAGTTVRGIHLTGRRAGEAAAAAGARRLVLTHIPAWTDPRRRLAEARGAYAGPVELARPGAVYEV